MPKKVTLVVLYEDEMHDTFINAFLNRMKMPAVGRSRLISQGKKSAVFDAFPAQVRALRASHVETRLIVVVDGDELSDSQIRDRFRQKLREANLDDDYAKDPILIVHPRWEMENWALHLLGESIGEGRDEGARKKVKARGRDAARLLADACKVGNQPANPLPSLASACGEWVAHRQKWNY